MEINKEQLIPIIEEVVKLIKKQLDGEQPKGETNTTASSSQAYIHTSSCSSGTACSGCGECVIKKTDAVKEFVSTGASRISAPANISGHDIARSGTELAEFIDHTLLKPDAKENEVVKLCKEAIQYKFASVCINPSYVPLCSKMLAGSNVKVCTVIGFPLGAMTTEAKAFETRDAVMKGADEIDMVINVGKLKSGDYKTVIEDIQGVVKSAPNKIVKVIIETSNLNDYEKVVACILAKAGGAHYVKTSTGFASGGATAKDVALMRKVVGEEMGVKASGGIRDYETAVNMIQAGATRIGASASVKIVTRDSKSEQKSY